MDTRKQCMIVMHYHFQCSNGIAFLYHLSKLSIPYKPSTSSSSDGVERRGTYEKIGHVYIIWEKILCLLIELIGITKLLEIRTRSFSVSCALCIALKIPISAAFVSCRSFQISWRSFTNFVHSSVGPFFFSIYSVQICTNRLAIMN